MHPDPDHNLPTNPVRAPGDPGPQSAPIPPIQHIASVTRFDDRSSGVTPLTDFLAWPCGTILLWVYVSPEHMLAKSNRYIFAYTPDPNGKKNRFSLCAQDSTKYRFRGWVLHFYGESSTPALSEVRFPFEDDLFGWRLFAIRWDRNTRRQVSFTIDHRPARVCPLPNPPSDDWPKPVHPHPLVIGRWPTYYTGCTADTWLYGWRAVPSWIDENTIHEIIALEGPDLNRNIIPLLAQQQSEHATRSCPTILPPPNTQTQNLDPAPPTSGHAANSSGRMSKLLIVLSLISAGVIPLYEHIIAKYLDPHLEKYMPWMVVAVALAILAAIAEYFSHKKCLRRLAICALTSVLLITILLAILSCRNWRDVSSKGKESVSSSTNVSEMVPPTVGPVALQPTSAPVVMQSTSAPVVTQPTSAPVVTQPTSAPVVNQPTGAPPAHPTLPPLRTPADGRNRDVMKEELEWRRVVDFQRDGVYATKYGNRYGANVRSNLFVKPVNSSQGKIDFIILPFADAPAESHQLLNDVPTNGTFVPFTSRFDRRSYRLKVTEYRGKGSTIRFVVEELVPKNTP